MPVCCAFPTIFYMITAVEAQIRGSLRNLGRRGFSIDYGERISC